MFTGVLSLTQDAILGLNDLFDGVDNRQEAQTSAGAPHVFSRDEPPRFLQFWDGCMLTFSRISPPLCFR